MEMDHLQSKALGAQPKAWQMGGFTERFGRGNYKAIEALMEGDGGPGHLTAEEFERLAQMPHSPEKMQDPNYPAFLEDTVEDEGRNIVDLCRKRDGGEILRMRVLADMMEQFYRPAGLTAFEPAFKELVDVTGFGR